VSRLVNSAAAAMDGVDYGMWMASPFCFWRWFNVSDRRFFLPAAAAAGLKRRTKTGENGQKGRSPKLK
jgi:hypothetical protein